ncbi:MAG: aldo/keto reductase [Alphaproteobacteria bacterium]|nr:aldo/keto reductase [Alphaproteobacteria bacterium]
MEQRTLGKSGLLVSVVGLGCNNFGGRTDFDGSKKVIHKAFDLGINLLDTADIYANKGGSEEVIGKVLGDRRKDIVLATKFCGQMDEAGKLKGASRRYIMGAVEASLKRLRTDWIDLYQIHMPDPLTPMEETLRALDDLVTAGKVRYVGCSNHKAWQVTEAEWISRRDGIERFVSCQDEYSLIVRDAEKELIPAMQSYGIGLLPYFPLAGGMLTGKYKRNAPMPEKSRLSYMQPLADRYMTEGNWQIVEKLTDFAAKRGRTMLELAFSWLACRPTVASVIAGATKPEQLEQNAAAAGWALMPADMAEIDKLSGR